MWERVPCEWGEPSHGHTHHIGGGKFGPSLVHGEERSAAAEFSNPGAFVADMDCYNGGQLIVGHEISPSKMRSCFHYEARS